MNQKLMCVNKKPFPVNNIAPPLTEGVEYELLEVHTCSCGEEHYNVGLPMKIVNYVECYKCRERLPDTTHWAHSSRFKKI